MMYLWAQTQLLDIRLGEDHQGEYCNSRDIKWALQFDKNIKNFAMSITISIWIMIIQVRQILPDEINCYFAAGFGTIILIQAD